MGPKFNDKCPYKRHVEDRERGGEGNVKME